MGGCLTFDMFPVSARSLLEIPSTEPKTADRELVKQEDVTLRVCRGIEKRSTPLELMFASTSAVSSD
jgi:hypothetical protein